MFVEFCGLCHSEPAVGQLTGHFQNLPGEEFTIMACKACAEKAFPKEGE